MSAYFVRKAESADLSAVRDLLSETWHATYDGFYGAARVSKIAGTWHSLEALSNRLARPDSAFLVADDGGRLCGMSFAAAGREPQLVVLHQLYVRPPYQGRGIGSDLLREVEASFSEAKRLRLEVEEANNEAVRFYRSRGFEPAGKADAVVVGEISLPALVFEKPLS